MTHTFVFGNGLGNVDAFGHDAAVVVKDLPLGVFSLDIKVRVTGLDFGSIDTHGEFVNPVILGPVAARLDKGGNDLSLGLLERNKWYQFCSAHSHPIHNPDHHPFLTFFCKNASK